MSVEQATILLAVPYQVTMNIVRTLIPVSLLLIASSGIADPIVSAPRDIGDFPLMPAVWDQEWPVVSSDGDDYAVFYRHRRDSTELRAARVTRFGEILDPFGIRIGETMFPYDVAWTGDHHLVSWIRQECELTGPFCLQLTAFTPSGEVSHLVQLPTSEGAKIAVGNESILVVWAEWRDDAQARMVLGQILTLDLEPAGSFFEISAENSSFLPPEVVATPAGFLVLNVIEGDRLTAFPISSNGVPGESMTVVEGDVFVADVASNGITIGVLFGRNGTLSFASLDAQGQRVRDPVDLLLGPSRLLPDGDDFLLVTSQIEIVAERTSLILHTLTAEGNLGPPWNLGSVSRNARLSGFLGTNGSLLVLLEERVGDGWSDPGGLNQHVGIYDRALQPVRHPAPLMISAPVQRASVVAVSRESFLHVWEEYRDGIWQLYSQPTSFEGQPTAWPIDHPHGNLFSVVSDGVTFLLATNRLGWFEGNGYRPFIELTRLNSSGDVELRRALPGHSIDPKVAWDGQSYLLSWKEFGSGSAGKLARIDENLTVTGPTVDITSYSDVVGFDGGVYLLDTIEGPRPYPDLPATRGLDVRVVSTELIVGPRTILIAPSVEIPVRSVLNEAIATNGREALIIWNQYERNGEGGSEWGYRRRSAVVNPSGNLISESSGDLLRYAETPTGAMVWDGQRYLAAATGDALVLQYVSRSGIFDELIRIPIDTYPGVISLASPGGGRAVVDYSAFVTNDQVGVGVERVLTRTITNERDRGRAVRRRP